MTIPNMLETIRKKYPTRLTRGRAIKLYCKENCCGDLLSWKDCQQKACFLWNFHLGKEILGNQTSFKKSNGKSHHFSAKTPITADNQTPVNSSFDQAQITPGSFVQTKLSGVQNG